MTLAQCRKALVATLGTALSAYVAAWAQNNGVLPGWPTVSVAVGLGITAGLTVFGVPNARPVPKVAAHLPAAHARHGAR